MHEFKHISQTRHILVDSSSRSNHPYLPTLELKLGIGMVSANHVRGLGWYERVRVGALELRYGAKV
jgi:hypothetical protein